MFHRRVSEEMSECVVLARLRHDERVASANYQGERLRAAATAAFSVLGDLGFQMR